MYFRLAQCKVLIRRFVFGIGPDTVSAAGAEKKIPLIDASIRPSNFSFPFSTTQMKQPAHSRKHRRLTYFSPFHTKGRQLGVTSRRLKGGRERRYFPHAADYFYFATRKHRRQTYFSPFHTKGRQSGSDFPPFNGCGERIFPTHNRLFLSFPFRS